MALPRQTIALLDAARELVKDKVAETVLLLTETKLDWDEVCASQGLPTAGRRREQRHHRADKKRNQSRRHRSRPRTRACSRADELGVA